MAFNQDFFAPAAPNATPAPQHWTYSTGDTIAEVSTADYFASKRFQLDVGDYIYVMAADGVTELTYQGVGEPSTPLNDGATELVLLGFDDGDQVPTALDTPIQVSFGPAQTPANGTVTLAADGTITILKAGIYNFIGIFDFGRVGGAGGTAVLYLRALVNGVQLGRPLVALVDNADILVSLQFQLGSFLNVGDVVTTELYRDSSGVNQGGLYTRTPALAWGDIPSARIRVNRQHG